MGTHPIFESDFDCLTEMLNLCRLLRQVKIEPTVRVQPMASVGTLSMTSVAESRVEKAWTQRRTRRHQYMKIQFRRKEEFEADQHFRFQKSVARKKHFVDNVWRQYGLKEAPPKLTAEKKEQLIKKYVEQGVFNAPLSTNEVCHYTVVNPSGYGASWYAKSYPRMWRPKYQGVQNPIPIERMINPRTGKRFQPRTIAKYNTKRHQWEKKQRQKLGLLSHERGRGSHGWVSLRDSLERKHIERLRPLPKWTAERPSAFKPLDRKPMNGNGARQKHYDVLNGYFDDDFVTPWRHFALDTYQDVNGSGFNKLPVFNKHYVHGWSNPENFQFHQVGAMQRTRKNKIMTRAKHMRHWKSGRGPQDRKKA